MCQRMLFAEGPAPRRYVRRPQKWAVAMAMREGRLLPQWAHLYPGLEPGVWAVAAQLVPLVLRNRLQAQPTWEFTRRILVDEHFEFRGGRPRDRSWSGILSRVDDA
jgi:hypothetical protein